MPQRRPPSSAPRALQLPAGYLPIRDILEHSVPVNKFVSIIGLVKDHWKSSLTLFDRSIENEYTGVNVNIFRPKAEMPEPDAGDVVIAHSIKVQNYRGEVSLITHSSTTLHVYSANKIPRPPKSAKDALGAPLQPKRWIPGDKEHEYVAWLYHSINKDDVPDAAAFNIKVDQSRNARQKYQLLKDVQDLQFYDIIGRVVREPYSQIDIATLWISDYTENDQFFEFSSDPTEAPMPQGGTGSWPGPFGKRSIQVTCFGLHAQFALEKVKPGDWVQLRNVQVKYGRNSSNLEGYLREDQSSYGRGIQVDILPVLEDPDNIDDRVKAAIRRRAEYEKSFKRARKSAAANQGGKRKADNQDDAKTRRKQRRAAERESKFKEIDEMEQERQRKKEAELGLNQIIKCENSDKPIDSIPFILEPWPPWLTTVGKEQASITLPFNCVQHRANVRVVDFRPSKLEDFATWRRSTELDCLSDWSSDSDSETDEEDDDADVSGRAASKVWEWQFALLLEEADPKEKGKNDALWAIVDNEQAQLLTDIDATDLRANPQSLDRLREQLFQLWGNLEEIKQQQMQRAEANRKRVAAQRPPPESSPPQAPPAAAEEEAQTTTAARGKETAPALSNKPFTCCLSQRGVAVRETDPLKANAGKRKRYESVFSMFGVKIGS
ncbi:hypothetical protein GGR52DRAFT_584823 [Hypoxylon sp. FL1284]|nr:hypothetical protein GGR52DRAFT_584823 [Hypoxylon sp. FL1284]